MVNKMYRTLLVFCLLVPCQVVYGYEKVLSIGYQAHDAEWETGDLEFDNQDYSGSDYHFGFRLYNVFKTKHKLGLGLDFEKILSENLIGYRALDYQYEVTERVHAGAFFGAATIETGLPQNGYYYGVNSSLFIFSNKLALHYELKVGDGLARDRLLDSDPEGDDPEIERPDIFLDFTSHTLSARWYF